MPSKESRLDNLLKQIYGKDVVDNAYASPAGRLTKAQAKADIKALFLGLINEKDVNDVIEYGNEGEEREKLRQELRTKVQSL